MPGHLPGVFCGLDLGVLHSGSVSGMSFSILEDGAQLRWKWELGSSEVF
jgi:hypothetical protein